MAEDEHGPPIRALEREHWVTEDDTKIQQKLWVHLGKLGLDPSLCEGLAGRILALFEEFGHPQLRGRATTRLATHLVQIRIRHEYVDH